MVLNNESKSQFWEEIYLADDAGWDLGGVTPVFEAIAGEINPGKLCIVGCGRGYDAVMFAEKGFDVTAVDFAVSPINELKALAAKKGVKVSAVQSDIFHLAPEYENAFDYVIEQTCFCAIDPRRRQEYESIVRSILKSRGRLIGLWFPLNKTMEEGGPPWGTTLKEVKSIFNKGWELEKEEFPVLSVEPRKGREKLIIFKKC